MSIKYILFRNEVFFKNMLNLASALSVILIPIIVAFMGNKYQIEMKNKESQENQHKIELEDKINQNKLSQEYIKIALDILNKKSTNDEDKNIRQWAIDIINHYSVPKMNENTKSSLMFNTLGLGIFDTPSSNLEQLPVVFTWEGKSSERYGFELEKFENNQWVTAQNKCEVLYENKKIEMLTKKQKYRWRVINADTNKESVWHEITI